MGTCPCTTKAIDQRIKEVRREIKESLYSAKYSRNHGYSWSMHDTFKALRKEIDELEDLYAKSMKEGPRR